MTPQAWKEIKEIVASAADLGGEELRAYLDARCPPEHRREVDELLAAGSTRTDLLEIDAVTAAIGSGTERSGERVGAYQLVTELGSGGMGSVYLATRSDGAFDQQVALKLIRRGMNSDAILQRFVTERQILASLEHPNIARLIDGGTTDEGLPYFVMEYVEGEPINRYAERRELGLEARLDLFRDICSAVSFAHQNLIIHRDLKPSNILVTGEGKVKLLDFGIAKLLKTDEGDARTATRNVVFTPEYASPEQVRGDQLTTASDVYSLGVVLYELLSGRRPYATDGRAISEIIRAVCETEPTAPSRGNTEGRSDTSERSDPRTLPFPAAQLRGDLDNIILKALRKDAERRYPSVEQFADDIKRYLQGLPVSARQDTWRYRSAKFVRRHRLVVAAAAAAVLILIGGSTTTFYQWRTANAERVKAENRFNDVRKLANSFIFEIGDEIAKSPIKARALLVQRAVEYLDKLSAESTSDLELKSELANAYERIALLQAQFMRPSLGKTSEGVVNHNKALTLRSEIYGAEPTVSRGVDVAASHSFLAETLMTTGQIHESLENTRKAIGIVEPLAFGGGDNYKARRRLAVAYTVLGLGTLRSSSMAETLQNYEKGLAIYEQLGRENPADKDFESQLGVLHSYIGFAKQEMGRKDEAVAHRAKWLELEEAAVARETVAGRKHHLARAHTYYGATLAEAGRPDEAFKHLEEGVRIQEETVNADKDNQGEQSSLADIYLEYGIAADKYDRNADAIKYFSRAAELFGAISEKDAENLWVKRRVANSRRLLADVYMETGDLAKAAEIYRETLAVFEDLATRFPAYSEWQMDFAMNHLRLSELSLKLKDEAAARRSLEIAAPIFEKLVAQSPMTLRRQESLRKAKEYLAAI